MVGLARPAHIARRIEERNAGGSRQQGPHELDVGLEGVPGIRGPRVFALFGVIIRTGRWSLGAFADDAAFSDHVRTRCASWRFDEFFGAYG